MFQIKFLFSRNTANIGLGKPQFLIDDDDDDEEEEEEEEEEEKEEKEEEVMIRDSNYKSANVKWLTLTDSSSADSD